MGVLHAIVARTPAAAHAAEPGDPRVAGRLAPAHAGERSPPAARRGRGGRRAQRAGPKHRGKARPLPGLPSSQRHTVGRKTRVGGAARWLRVGRGRPWVVAVRGRRAGHRQDHPGGRVPRRTGGGDRTCRVARGRCSERLAGTEAYLPFLEALDRPAPRRRGEAMAQVMKVVAPTWYMQLVPLVADDSSFARVREEAKGASQERLKRRAGRLPPGGGAAPALWCCSWTICTGPMRRPWTCWLMSAASARRCDCCWCSPTARRTCCWVSTPFCTVKLELQGHGVCREILLDFLTRADLERYLAMEFPGHGFPAEFAALIHTRTEGNPLFMVDVAALLARARRDRPGARPLGADAIGCRHPAGAARVGAQHDSAENRSAQRSRPPLAGGRQRAGIRVRRRGRGRKVLCLEAAEVEERLGALERVHAFVRRPGSGSFRMRL